MNASIMEHSPTTLLVWPFLEKKFKFQSETSQTDMNMNITSSVEQPEVGKEHGYHKYLLNEFFFISLQPSLMVNPCNRVSRHKKILRKI